MEEMSLQLVSVNPGLSPYQFESLRLACIGLNISRHYLEVATTFTDLYKLIEQTVPQYAPSLACQMLCKVKYPPSKLKNLYSCVKEEVSIEGYPTLDLILTVAVIIGDMTHNSYKKFKGYAHRTFLSNHHPSRITSRTVLMQLLIDANFMIPTNIGYLFAWLEASSCSEKLYFGLRDYCQRHGINFNTAGVINMEVPSFYQQQCFEMERSINSITEIVPNKSELTSQIKGYFCNRQSVPVLLVLIISLVFGIIFLLLFFWFHTHKDGHNGIMRSVGADSLVDLFTKYCYDPNRIKEIKLNVTFCDDDQSFNMTLFGSSDCDPLSTYHYKLNRKMNERSDGSRVIFANNWKSANYYDGPNYYQTNYPVYTAGPGVLYYSVNVSFADELNSDSCPFQLCIFNNFSSYYTATNFNMLWSPYNCSECLTGMNDDIEFPLNEEGFYYGAYHVKADAYVTLTTSGELMKYNATQLSSIKECTITQTNTHCSLGIHKVFRVLANASLSEEVNVTVSVVENDWNPISIIALIFAGVLHLIAFVFVFAFACLFVCKYRNNYVQI